jgi:zona occludens toxin
MINFISGTPGAGKTCMGLTFMTKQTKEGRPLFVHGIPELKIPHIDVFCTSPNCDVCTTYTEEDKENMHQADLWHEWAPKGAVLFYDEVQNVYRPRSSGSKVPPSIQAFEVHRHRGLDFYLISQSPKLFDSNIRELISRHIHLKANWAGRFQYEWPECKLNTQSTSDAIKSRYVLDSKMFDKYKSASLHTKQKRKMPIAVYVFLAAVLGAGYLGTSVFARVTSAISGEPESELITESGGVAVAATPLAPANKPERTFQPIVSKLNFEPTIKGVLESAPAYSGLVQVKDYPKISACISGRQKCVCYTQQATVYPTTLQQCLDNVNRSPTSFNPFIEPEAKQVSTKQVNDA